jgi:cytoskeletal protein CcmA (bactofilin family)
MEVGMLNKLKHKAPEQDRSTVANDLEFLQPQRPVAETVALRSERTKSGPVSCIGSDMTIVGKIETDGPAQVFGRIEGEVRASDLMTENGAQIEGIVVAQNVTIRGRVKGTIRANRVKLENGGAVEGDIFHRSLSIDENSSFEGLSRRVENPTGLPSSVDPIDEKERHETYSQ